MKQTHSFQIQQKDANEQIDEFPLFSPIKPDEIEDKKINRMYSLQVKAINYEVQPPQCEPTDKYGNFIKNLMQESLSSPIKNNRQVKEDIKKINARVEKWRSMIPKLSQMVEKRDSELKQRTRKVDYVLCNNKRESLRVQEQLYGRSFVRSKKSKHQLALHTRVSYPNPINLPMISRQDQMLDEHSPTISILRYNNLQTNEKNNNVVIGSLIQILNVLSILLPEIGYCQGMNFITASIMMVVNDENTLWILYQIMTQYKQLDKYIDPLRLYRQFYVLEALIEKFLPQIGQLFKKLQITTFFYATEWLLKKYYIFNRFISLFSSVLPLQLFYRVFDIFLVEGEKTIYRCALAILDIKQKGLIEKNDFEEDLFYLRNNQLLQNIDQDNFILIMTKKFQFSKKYIDDLYKQYDAKQVHEN